METLTITYTGDLRTKMIHSLSGSIIETDAPVDNQGKGSAFSPTDMLAGGLAGCILTTMGIVARIHDFNIDGTTAKVTKIMGSDPRRIVEIIMEFTFPKGYTDVQMKLIEKSIKHCPAGNSLHPDLKQTVITHFTK